MRFVLSAALLILVLGFAQCTRPGNPQHSIPGEYDLVARDNAGQLVFTGTISLVSLEQNFLKGQCRIVKEKNALEGLLDKSAGCEAFIDGKQLSLDSASSTDDAGLLLLGQLDEGRIIGIWTIKGVTIGPPLGKFEAVKKK